MKATIIIMALTIASIEALADPNGKDFFERRCSGCHALDRDKEGPRLRGVHGRTSGTVSTFHYSDALQKSHITWNSESLDRWLTDPEKFVPDSDMAFHVEDAAERRAIIGYLKELSSK
jgi:cytochrome c